MMNPPPPPNTTTKKAPAAKGIGWSNGIAAQVSLPSISVPRARRDADLWPRVGCRGSGRVGHRQGFEKSRHDVAVCRRRDGAAGLRQFREALGVQLAPAGTRGLDPILETLLVERDRVETHVGEPVAAELRGEAGIGSGSVSEQMQLGRHPGHRVDLAAELRHEKAVPDGGRSEPKTQRPSRRHNEPIDARNLLVRIDEQPFPVQRYDLN